VLAVSPPPHPLDGAVAPQLLTALKNQILILKKYFTV